MTYDFETSGSSGVMKFKGELVLEHAKKIKTALLESMGQMNNIAIDLKQVTQIDLSCLQVFCSAHRTFDTQKKVLSFVENGEGLIVQTLNQAGLMKNKACGLELDTACLWGGGS